MEIEVCVERYEEAEVTNDFDVARIELCGPLDIGGVTPSAGLIAKCVSDVRAETHVMIRPRGGSFVYSEADLSIMAADISAAADLGAVGVVFGVLDANNTIDATANRGLLTLARSRGLKSTFHRAIDLHIRAESSPASVIETLVELGFDRILTAGGAANAAEGIETIRQLVSAARDRVEVMAGGGVGPSNCREFDSAGVHAIHFTIRTPSESPGRTGSTEEESQEPGAETSVLTTASIGADYRSDREKLAEILSVCGK